MIIRRLGLLVVLSLSSCEAQSASSKPLEPTSIGVVFFLNSSSQTLKPLQDEAWKAQGNGFFTATGSIQVSGESSSVRIAASDKTEFVFNIEHPQNARLYRFTQKKHQRYFEIVKISHGGRTRENLPGIPVDITKFGESSYRLVPQSPLSPGEYVILTGPKIFSFGIDPDSR